MRFPAVAPVNDTALRDVLRTLRNVHDTFGNGFTGRASQLLERYRSESVRAAERLGSAFSAADVESMVLTRRHWLLMSMEPTPVNEPIISDLVVAESRARADYFDALIKELQGIEQRWEDSTRTLIVPDTNVLLHQDQTFEYIAWAELAGAAEVRLMIPMQVVRELDRHKNSTRNAPVSDTCKETVRVRVRKTVHCLRELFAAPGDVVSLASGVEAELLLDAPGHRPDKDGDAEIIDRALALSRLARRPVMLATADAAMGFAAQIDGLTVLSL